MHETTAFLNQLERALNANIDRRKYLARDILANLKKAQNIRCELVSATEARTILQVLAKEAQNEGVYSIIDIINMALSAVFEEEIKFTIEFIEKRNKTEVEMYLQDKDGNRTAPRWDEAGGILDIVFLAFRISLWAMSKPSPVIILDEPVKNLSKPQQINASKILKTLSEELNLQFILVTHETALIESADRVFEVTKKNGVSNVEVI